MIEAMQDFPLTLDKFLVHAAKWHPRAEVVTGREGGTVDRVTYAQLMQRSLRVSAVLADLGVAFGDRVATLAWNTQAHVEAWYAVMGMGAVCHTLNPRLTAAQLGAMLAASGCRVLFASADLMPLARQLLEQSATQVRNVLIIDGAPDSAPTHDRSLAMALDQVIGEARSSVTWGGFDERTPSGLCFTSGTTGSPKGVEYTHRSVSYTHLRAH